MSADLPQSIRLNVVMYREGDYWVGHCVELDLLTSGASLKETWDDIQDVCRGQILYAAAHDPGFDHLFRPPSERLMKMLSLGRDQGEAVVQLDAKSVDWRFSDTRDLRIHMVVAECCAA